MFQKKYYCLVAGLPDLMVGEKKKGLTSLQFKLELANQLNKTDYRLLEIYYRQTDNKNLLNLLLKKNHEHDMLGNYPADYLQAQIACPTTIEPYMKRFLHEIKKEKPDEPAIRYETRLLELFYLFISESGNQFLKQWFRFDQIARNIFASVNSFKYQYNLADQLIMSSTDRNLHQEFMRFKIRHNVFEEEESDCFAQILQVAGSDLSALEKEKEIDKIRWAYLDEITVFHYFSIEKILSFVVKLNMVDRWRDLEADQGKAFFNQLIKELESGYSFREEFDLTPKR